MYNKSVGDTGGQSNFADQHVISQAGGGKGRVSIKRYV